MPGPDELIAQMMARQGGGGMPMGAAPPQPQGPPTDEAMLAQVQQGMGNEGGPPPGSGMKWQVLEDDQQALLTDPSPENIDAFVRYWGEESLPKELQGGNGPPEAAEGEY